MSAVGTGGTLTGVGEVLKSRKPRVHCVAVEPRTAAVLSGDTAGAHKIPGIGVGFVPAVLNRSVIHEVVTGTDDEALPQLAIWRATESWRARLQERRFTQRLRWHVGERCSGRRWSCCLRTAQSGTSRQI